jgi:hypothetical protein
MASCSNGWESVKVDSGSRMRAEPNQKLNLSLVNDERKAYPDIMTLACLAFAISIVFEIFSARCLYGDGSFNYINDLANGKFAGFSGVRSIADDIFEFPMLVAMRLGVTNLFWLRLLFGIGRLIPWPVALLLCYRTAPRHFWLATLACGAGYLNASFVAVGEHIVAHAFFWPAVFALVFARPLTPFAASALLLSAAILLESYESLLFLGPPLALLALWRVFDRQEIAWARGIFLAAAALFILAAVIALTAVSKPSNGRELGGFRMDALAILLNPGWTIKWTALWICLMAGICFSEQFRRIATHPTAPIFLIIAIGLWGAWPLLKPDDLNPARQFNARFLDLAIPLAMLPLSFAVTAVPKWFESRRRQLVVLSAALLLAQSLWQISATCQWQRFTGILRGVLVSRTGYLSLSQTPLSENPGKSLHFVGGVFDWDNPCLCIALSPGGRVRMMLHSAPDGYAARWQPFDPLDPKTFPELSRYGVDYSDYQAAIGVATTK